MGEPNDPRESAPNNIFDSLQELDPEPFRKFEEALPRRALIDAEYNEKKYFGIELGGEPYFVVFKRGINAATESEPVFECDLYDKEYRVSIVTFKADDFVSFDSRPDVGEDIGDVTIDHVVKKQALQELPPEVFADLFIWFSERALLDAANTMEKPVVHVVKAALDEDDPQPERRFTPHVFKGLVGETLLQNGYVVEEPTAGSYDADSVLHQWSKVFRPQGA